MTEEAAESRGPATTGTGPSPDRPAPSVPLSDDAPAPDAEPTGPAPDTEPTGPGAGTTDGRPPPPPPGAGQVPPTAPPPWFGASDTGPTFVKENLVRPTRGRYVAGVCAALGRATNTDPVLWRVLVAVLGLFGGVGVLIYLIGWLVIPGEGDTASPIESLLGRGRSGMAPFSIVLLGGAAVLTFAFVVNDGFRAALLAGAVLIGAALLLKRNAGQAAFPTPPGPTDVPAGPGAPAPSSTGPDVAFPGAADAPPAAPADPTVAFASTAPAAAPAAPADEPVTAPLPPLPPEPPTAPFSAPPSFTAPPSFAPPAGGYRPPFAPHGPWAGQQPPPPPPATKAAKPPKPPREKSKLGRITFFGVLVVVGVLALIDTAGFSVPVSAYFAATLATIALGLIVGAWFGRARGLIALALIATVGLGISTGIERFGGHVTNSVYRPQTVPAIADRYDFTLGNATLDLRGVNFTGAQQETTLEMRAGQIRVLLPENVDTTADVRMENGRTLVFGRESDGRDITGQTLTDLGADGTGGGTLHLIIEMGAGNVEVTR